MKMKTMKHKFVELIPEKLEENILYISLEHTTAIHKCVCGCGNEVVTPISPTDWQLIFNGEAVTLRPSIGNWSFPCKSHYFIINNKIKMAGKIPKWQIDLGRKTDHEKKQKYYDKKKSDSNLTPD